MLKLNSPRIDSNFLYRVPRDESISVFWKLEAYSRRKVDLYKNIFYSDLGNKEFKLKSKILNWCRVYLIQHVLGSHHDISWIAIERDLYFYSSHKFAGRECPKMRRLNWNHSRYLLNLVKRIKYVNIKTSRIVCFYSFVDVWQFFIKLFWLALHENSRGVFKQRNYTHTYKQCNDHGTNRIGNMPVEESDQKRWYDYSHWAEGICQDM